MTFFVFLKYTLLFLSTTFSMSKHERKIGHFVSPGQLQQCLIQEELSIDARNIKLIMQINCFANSCMGNNQFWQLWGNLNQGSRLNINSRNVEEWVE